MFVQRTFFCFVAYIVSLSYNAVLRLPCLRHGNFSVRHKDKYMTQVTLLDTLSIPTVANCVIKCIGHDTCQHLNYQAEVESCELLDEGEGILVEKTNSEYLTTQKEEENHGPFCKSVAPCLVTEECFDTCDALRYRCERRTDLLEKNIILQTVPFLSKQWVLSIDIKPLGLSGGYTSIFHATIGDDNYHYGDRTPAAWFLSGTTSLQIGSAINGIIDHYFVCAPLPMEVYTNVKVEQRLVGAQYIYRIYIGGIKVYEVVNTAPSDFSNVILYAADPWYPAAKAVIKNLSFNNL